MQLQLFYSYKLESWGTTMRLAAATHFHMCCSLTTSSSVWSHTHTEEASNNYLSGYLFMQCETIIKRLAGARRLTKAALGSISRNSSSKSFNFTSHKLSNLQI